MISGEGEPAQEIKETVGGGQDAELPASSDTRPSSDPMRGWRPVIAWAATPAGGVALLIFGAFVARLLFAAALGLGVDESYMVAAGREWQLSYFDHPPLAWWLAWAMARLTGNDSPIVVRLPFIALFALTTLLMYRATAASFGRPAGLWAAIVLNLAPMLGITAASWVLPDGPLFAGLLGAAFCLTAALPSEGGRAWGWWLAAGACAGLAMLAKYSAVLTILGAFLYLLSEPAGRRWLARPQPYAAGLVVFILFLPVVTWNARHGWVSFRFQGERATGAVHMLGPLATTAGGALFLLPWLWLALVLGGYAALRRGPGEPKSWLWVCLALPPLVFFTVVSLWSHVLFHWAAPGYLMLAPLLGDAIARRGRADQLVRRWLIATVAVVVLGAGFVASEVRFNWLPYAIFPGGKDPALAAVDWTSLRRELAERGLLGRPGLVVAATRWLDAGKLDYAFDGQVPVLCLGPDPRQYGLIAPLSRYSGDDVLIVAPNSWFAGIKAQFGSQFDAIEPLMPATILHAGRPALTVPLYIGHRLHQPA